MRALSLPDCEELLARHHVGRLAFAFCDRVDIQPVHYVYDAGWIYGRTSGGAKLTALTHHPWVAFEVDEVRDTFDWASVVVKGSFHRLDPGGSPREGAVAVYAAALLRTLVPATLTTEDPVPFRAVLYRIALDEVTGRAASPRATDTP